MWHLRLVIGISSHSRMYRRWSHPTSRRPRLVSSLRLHPSSHHRYRALVPTSQRSKIWTFNSVRRPWKRSPRNLLQSPNCPSSPRLQRSILALDPLELNPRIHWPTATASPLLPTSPNSRRPSDHPPPRTVSQSKLQVAPAQVVSAQTAQGMHPTPDPNTRLPHSPVHRPPTSPTHNGNRSPLHPLQ